MNLTILSIDQNDSFSGPCPLFARSIYVHACMNTPTSRPKFHCAKESALVGWEAYYKITPWINLKTDFDANRYTDKYMHPKIVLSTHGHLPIASLSQLKKKGVHIIEYRVDQDTSQDPLSVTKRLAALKRARLPILVTVRSQKEGGLQKLSKKERLHLYTACLPDASLIDIELAASTHWSPLMHKARKSRVTIIGSYHNFKRTPDRKGLQTQLQIGLRQGVDLIKIACYARSEKELQTLLLFTLENQKAPLATMAMGPYGALSRIALPLAGSRLLYTCLGKPFAPGQIPLQELMPLLKRFYPTR